MNHNSSKRINWHFLNILLTLQLSLSGEIKFCKTWHPIHNNKSNMKRWCKYCKPPIIYLIDRHIWGNFSKIQIKPHFFLEETFDISILLTFKPSVKYVLLFILLINLIWNSSVNTNLWTLPYKDCLPLISAVRFVLTLWPLSWCSMARTRYHVSRRQAWLVQGLPIIRWKT